MKEINLPKITLSKPEKIWLNKLYDKIKANEKISYKNIRVELFKDLPYNFHPNSIDRKLVGYNGEDITLQGIYAIEPKSDILQRASIVMNAVRESLIKEPQRKTIQAKEIAGSINIPVSEVGLVFKLISPYGQFWRSASSNNEYYGYSSVDIGDDNEVFDQYLYFTSIEDLINNYYQEEEQKNKYEKQQVESNELSIDLNIKPIFTSRISQIDMKLCFVLMPFTENWSDRVYRKYIRENIEFMGLQCLRADNLTGQIVIEDIWTKINQAAFIIADVTNRNPNVMYELGIAHTVGKPVILITQDIKNIPFDFTHLRHHIYEDNVDGQEFFSKQLREVVSSIYTKNYPGIGLKL